MIERGYEFLPSLLILIAIYTAFNTYIVLKIKKMEGNLEKHDELTYRKSKRLVSLFYRIIIYILAPIKEELIFRAPLIIIFPIISFNAWIGILLSSAIFGIKHYYFQGRKGLAGIREFISEKREKSDYREIRKIKIINLIASIILGILLGYCGVKYQSIVLVIIIHSLCNLFLPTIIYWLMIIALLIIKFPYVIKKVKEIKQQRGA